MKKRMKMVRVGLVALLLLASMMFGTVNASAGGVYRQATADCNVNEFSYVLGGTGTYKTVDIRKAIPSAYIKGTQMTPAEDKCHSAEIYFNTKSFKIDGKNAYVDKMEAVMSGKYITGTEKRTLKKELEDTDQADYRFSINYFTTDHLEFILMYVTLSDGTSTYFYVGVNQEIDNTIKRVENKMINAAAG